GLLLPGSDAQAPPPAEFCHGGRWLRREVRQTASLQNELLVVTEITADKRADDERERSCRAQAQQAAHLRRLLEATPEGVLSLDPAAAATPRGWASRGLSNGAPRDRRGQARRGRGRKGPPTATASSTCPGARPPHSPGGGRSPAAVRETRLRFGQRSKPATVRV